MPFFPKLASRFMSSEAGSNRTPRNKASKSTAIGAGGAGAVAGWDGGGAQAGAVTARPDARHSAATDDTRIASMGERESIDRPPVGARDELPR